MLRLRTKFTAFMLISAISFQSYAQKKTNSFDDSIQKVVVSSKYDKNEKKTNSSKELSLQKINSISNINLPFEETPSIYGERVVTIPFSPNISNDAVVRLDNGVTKVEHVANIQFDKTYKIYKITFENGKFRCYQRLDEGGLISRGKNVFTLPIVTMQPSFSAINLANDPNNLDIVTGETGLLQSFRHPILNENYSYYNSMVDSRPEGGVYTPIPNGKMGVPLVVSWWLGDSNDWFNCSSDSWLYPNCNPAGYKGRTNGGESRLKISAHLDKTLPPFYAHWLPLPLMIGNNDQSNLFNGLAKFNVKFDQAAFDKSLEYIYEAGIDVVDFYFYDPKDADVAEHVKYNMTTANYRAQKVKYYYTLGSLGYEAKVNLDLILQQMGTQRYFKQNGKPVLCIDSPSDSKFHIDRYILSEAATFVQDENESYYKQIGNYEGPILFSPATGYVKASGLTPVRIMLDYLKAQCRQMFGLEPYIIAQGGWFYYSQNDIIHDAISAYTLPPTNFGVNHTYQNLINFNIDQLNGMGSKIVVPVITTGFENIWVDGQRAAFSNSATPNELKQHMTLVKNWITAHPGLVPFVKIYSFGETSEAGSGALVPRLKLDGGIDDSMIKAVRDF